jgi:hypothetical protein
MNRSRTISLLVAGLALAAPAVASADSRVVVEKNLRLTRDWSGNTDCAGMSFSEHYDVRRTITDVYADDGELRREVVHVHFTGTATNEATGGSIPVDGTRNMVFDFEAGTFTETGVIRHVTARGEGIVLHDAGRWIEDLDDETVVLFSGGHHQLRTGDLSGFCSALASA